MHISLTPVLDYTPLHLRRAGSTLLINGAALDLAALPEGARLPAEVVDCLWLVPGSVVTRIDGALHLSLRRPYPGGEAPAPATLTLEDGAELVFAAPDEPEPVGDAA